MRSAGALLLLAALAAACGGGPEPVDGDVAGSPATNLQQVLDDLRKNPGTLPFIPMKESEEFVLLMLEGTEKRVDIYREPILMPRPSFKLERALVEQRRTVPILWVIVTDDLGKVQYWAPVDPRPKIRVSIPPPPGEPKTPLKGGMLPLYQMVVPLRVPFVRFGTVGFYQPDGTPAGIYGYGEHPTDRLVEDRS